MRATTAALLVAGLLAALALAGPSGAQDAGEQEAGPPALKVYGNPISSRGAMQELDKLPGGRCGRRFASRGKNMSVEVGRSTARCEYATPVVGRDLDIAVTAVLSKQTPRTRRKKIFVFVALRVSGTVAYVLEVEPRNRRWFLRRTAPEGDDPTPRRRTFAQGKGKVVANTGRKNRLRMRVFGNELIAWINGEVVARGSDPAFEAIDGRLSTFGIGSAANASKAVGIFDNIVVQVPDPLL